MGAPEVPQHGGRHLTRERTLRFGANRLRSDLNGAALYGAHNFGQVRERRTNQHLGPRGLETLEQDIDEFGVLGTGAVHLPIASDERTTVHALLQGGERRRACYACAALNAMSA
jgi:hypothetical protein